VSKSSPDASSGATSSLSSLRSLSTKYSLNRSNGQRAAGDKVLLESHDWGDFADFFAGSDFGDVGMSGMKSSGIGSPNSSRTHGTWGGNLRGRGRLKFVKNFRLPMEDMAEWES